MVTLNLFQGLKDMYVYILTNSKNTPLYVGVTNDLVRRIYEHKNKIADGFTKRYNCNLLVYYEVFEDAYHAISREKQLKNWHNDWKLNLIKEMNPDFKDLYDEITR